MAAEQIRAKGIRYGIKHRMSVKDFCAKYDCTDEEFRRRLKVIYKHEADEIYREICTAANKDRNRQESVQRAADDDLATAVVVVETVVRDSPWQGPDPTCVQESVTDKIERLKVQESEQSSIVMNLENEHKGLANQRRGKIQELRKIQDDIDQLEAKFRKYAARYTRIVEESNEIAAEMNQISAKRREEKSALEEIRAQIRELETVILFVYDDGTIAPLDENLTVELDDTGFEAALSSLMQEKSCQDLRVKDIQIIARLSCIIKNSKVQIETVFENEEIELACLMLRDEGKF